MVRFYFNSILALQLIPLMLTTNLMQMKYRYSSIISLKKVFNKLKDSSHPNTNFIRNLPAHHVFTICRELIEYFKLTQGKKSYTFGGSISACPLQDRLVKIPFLSTDDIPMKVRKCPSVPEFWIGDGYIKSTIYVFTRISPDVEQLQFEDYVGNMVNVLDYNVDLLLRKAEIRRLKDMSKAYQDIKNI